MWDKCKVDFTRICYKNEENFSYSTIDHFFYSSGLIPCVKEVGVIHSPDNKSDHSPIYCIFSPFFLKTDVSDTTKPDPKPSWKSASDDQKNEYKTYLNELLSDIVVPLPLCSYFPPSSSAFF